MARALLIRLSSLGDVVLATSAVEALRRDRPDIEIDVLTKPAFASLFETNPAVSSVISWGEGISPAAMAASLKEKGYDYIADLHGNLRTRLLRLFLKGRWSVLSKGVLRRRLAVMLRSRRPLKGALHVTERYAGALKGLGVVKSAPPRIHLGEEALAWAQKVLIERGWDGHAPLVALAPGAAWATKAWPAERWRELTSLLRSKKNVFPVLTGGGGDRELCEGILSGEKGANLAGEADFIRTGALLSLARCLVTNDSAPLHMAGAVSTPVVALFGPTVPAYGFYPLGERDVVVERNEVCRPCALHGHKQCPLGHHDCLARIGAEEVFGPVARLLEIG